MSSWLVGPGELRKRAALRGAPPFFRDGLLCALVIAPSAFPRNRLTDLFSRPEAMQTRRRAAQLRSLVRQLAGNGPVVIELLEVSLPPAGEQAPTVVRYQIPRLRAERTAWLEPLELAVVRVAIGRVMAGGPERREALAVDPRIAPTAEDKTWIERVLWEWGRAIGLGATPNDGEEL